MTGRREFSAKVKEAAYTRSKGHCESCSRQLSPGDIHYDHDNPDANGGEPTLENCRVLCRSCHKIKTTTVDVPRIAKLKRNRRRNYGIRRGRSSFRTNKDQPFKKKISGEVVRR